MRPQPHQTPRDFWENLYRKSSPETNGEPSRALVRFITDRYPGTALDLGCAKGDDAVWLAKRGWHVVAVDISTTVLCYATANAEERGVAEQIDFQ